MMDTKASVMPPADDTMAAVGTFWPLTSQLGVLHSLMFYAIPMGPCLMWNNMFIIILCIYIYIYVYIYTYIHIDGYMGDVMSQQYTNVMAF